LVADSGVPVAAFAFSTILLTMSGRACKKAAGTVRNEHEFFGVRILLLLLPGQRHVLVCGRVGQDKKSGAHPPLFYFSPGPAGSAGGNAVIKMERPTFKVAGMRIQP